MFGFGSKLLLLIFFLELVGNFSFRFRLILNVRLEIEDTACQTRVQSSVLLDKSICCEGLDVSLHSEINLFLPICFLELAGSFFRFSLTLKARLEIEETARVFK